MYKSTYRNIERAELAFEEANRLGQTLIAPRMLFVTSEFAPSYCDCIGAPYFVIVDGVARPISNKWELASEMAYYR